MGLFSKPVKHEEVKAFGKGRTTSEKAAIEYANRAHARDSGRRADRARAAARAARAAGKPTKKGW